MEKDNRRELLKEYVFLTDLLKKHETGKKSAIQQSHQNLPPQVLNMNHTSNLQYKLVKHPTRSLTIFDKKFSFKNSDNPDIVNRKVVLNKNFTTKYRLTNNQTSRHISSPVKVGLKRDVNRNVLTVPKKTIPENRSDRKFSSHDKLHNIESRAKLMKEIESMTQLLKKKNSENKTLDSTNNNNILTNKPVTFAVNEKHSACSNDSSEKYKSNFPNIQNNIPQKVIPGNITSLNNRKLNMNCFSKLNQNNQTKHLTNLNKYSYRKVDSEPTNSKTSMALNAVENGDQAKNKQILRSRKVIYSNSKTSSKISCLNSYASLQTLKPFSPEKHNLTKKFNVTKGSVLLDDQLSRKLPDITKLSSSSLLNSKSPPLVKSTKSKSVGIMYIKANKYLTRPNRTVQLKSALDSAKKIKRKVNTKYKVVNKTLTPYSNKNKLNALGGLGSKNDSLIAVDKSDSFFQNLNDSSIAKLEKDLLTISTAALSSTPKSSESNTSCYKRTLHSLTKVNSSLCSKKTSLKKSKARMSKYKIVNSDSPQRYYVKKPQNFGNLNTGFKKAAYSRLVLVNKHSKPVHVLTPVKQGKSVLVKRIFKSKNAIINKNSNPASCSAKMIKSKYFMLYKRRKSTSWQKHTLYPKVPSQLNKFKGYNWRTKLPLHNRYQQSTSLTRHPKGHRKFSNYAYSTVNRQFRNGASKNKHKGKLKNGYVRSPVVFIHGMRYSLNSSGKTLKKLPGKGQTTKTHKRNVLKRIPENMRISTSNCSNVASRVLNRSINRILSASAKKKLKKVNIYCKFYNRFGRCNNGVKCAYIHDPSKIAVCTRFLKGTCKTDGCPFSHVRSPGKMAICSFFLVGACEKENCPYRHEQLLPEAVLCKAFVQGYCPSGKECKKAHILICPKYIQGDCDKDNSCGFPHPPRKVKKNVQKDDDGDKKPDDVLLEKVSRYFLQTEDSLSNQNESDKTNIANQFVPKHRRLEEQPSFIPLVDSPVSDS